MCSAMFTMRLIRQNSETRNIRKKDRTTMHIISGISPIVNTIYGGSSASNNVPTLKEGEANPCTGRACDHRWVIVRADYKHGTGRPS